MRLNCQAQSSALHGGCVCQFHSSQQGKAFQRTLKLQVLTVWLVECLGVRCRIRDQAASLRELMRLCRLNVIVPARTVVVVSGKGGVGKTTLSVNLALEIALQVDDGDILLWDADMSLANANVLLNIEPKATIVDVLSGKAQIDEALIKFHKHACLLPGGLGIHWLASLTDGDAEVILMLMMSVMHPFKFVIVDAPAGIGAVILALIGLSYLTLLVTTPDPAAITDAYALSKAVKMDGLICRPYILLNMSESDGLLVGRRLSETCKRFLGIDADLLAAIPKDFWVREASRQRIPLLKLAPMSSAALSIKRLSSYLIKLLEGSGEAIC